MARPNVPKFGNWENDDNTPYTVYFEKARQTRGTGKMMNPNDPEENPDMFRNLAPPPEVAPQSKPKRQTEEPPIGRGGPARQTRDHRLSKEDGEFRQYANSPARKESVGRKGANEPSHQRGRGSNSGRTGRQSIGSEHSFDKSPLHPHYQAKVSNAGRGVASPAWEGKNNSYDSSHGTPGRSKVKQDKQSDRGAAVPRFGEWDENDPQSADNYTHIFNKFREEKQGNPSGTPSRTSNNTQKHNSEEKQRKWCCCPW
ncbi:RPM1-interacting protein 4 isoform X1 [Solanum lycopersicum]|uniref:RPM1-interacting protein 4 isoform X1 n=1 Tax=Solanum lycopersicum TaxID=4081 RepID=UPI000532B479|nr:RPM1-interacting protein 4 isoform X1 [Solanum lycopersicum]